MYQALYRKWRPQSFADVIGQSAVTETLSRQVETGKLSHAYLFSGSRGTGKTTCAKILARAANCEDPFHGNPCNKCPSCLGILDGRILDVVEIDAASNNGVDNVRELREEAIYTPANVKRRVYIIDEVHMFSGSAFNALLKIMEEPPAHVMFILATTELHKVPATIASRCQKFVFKRISSSAIASRLVQIAKSESAELTEEAAEYIASLSDGAMRDAVSLLDQCLSLGAGKVTVETVEGVIGLAGRAETLALVGAIGRRETGRALEILNDIYKGGRNLTSVMAELSEILRDILVVKTAPGERIPRIDARYSEDELAPIGELFDAARLIDAIGDIQSTTGAIAASTNRRIDAELCCVRLCEGGRGGDIRSLISRIDALERRAADTAPAPAPAAARAESAIVAPPEARPASEPGSARKSAQGAATARRTDSTEQRESETEPEARRRASATDDAGTWKRILDEAKCRLSPGIYPLLAGAKAVREGNMLVLSSDNSFVMKMLTQKANMDILRETAKTISEELMITASERPPEKPQEASGLDELLSGIEDKSGIIIK